MTFEKRYNVQGNNQLVINLPERFKSRKRVRVIIEDIDENRDIIEISSDFEISDSEVL